MDLDNLFMIFARRWRFFSAGSLVVFIAFGANIPFLAGRFKSECKAVFAAPLTGGLDGLKELGLLEPFSSAALLPVLTSNAVDQRVRAGLAAEGGTTPPSAGLLSKLEIKKGDGPVLLISLTDSDPARVARTLDLFLEKAALVLDDRVREEVEAARRKIAAWRADIEGSLARERDELEKQRGKLGLAGTAIGYDETLREMADAVHQRQVRSEELEAAERQAAEELRALEDRGDMEVTAENIDSVLGDLPAMAWFRELNEKVIKDEIRLLVALRTSTDLHPEVRAIRNEVESDRKLIESIFEEGQVLNQYLKRMKTFVKSDAERKALAKKVQLRTFASLAAANREKLQDESGRVACLEETKDAYVSLSRAITAGERNRTRLDLAQADLALLDRSRDATLKPLQPPTAPERQGRTPIQMFGLALVLALMVGLALACFRDMKDDRIHCAGDLVRRSGLSPLAEIPWPTPGVSEPAGRDAFDRAARLLLARNDDLRTVLIAGVEGGTGRSTIAAGLALAASRLGRKTALVDAAGRRPVLHRMFGRVNRYGLSDLLSGELALRRRVERLSAKDGGRPGRRLVACPTAAGTLDEPCSGDRNDDLLVIPAGSPGRDFARLLESPALAALLDELTASFDLIIIDSTPLAESGEALSLAARADAVILVTRAGVTRASALAWARKQIDGVGGSVAGAIINGTKRVARLARLPEPDRADPGFPEAGAGASRRCVAEV